MFSFFLSKTGVLMYVFVCVWVGIYLRVQTKTFNEFLVVFSGISNSLFRPSHSHEF